MDIEKVIANTKKNFPTAKIIGRTKHSIVAAYYTPDGRYYICMVSDERGRGVNVRVPAKDGSGWEYDSLFTTKYDEDHVILQRYPCDINTTT